MFHEGGSGVGSIFSFPFLDDILSSFYSMRKCMKVDCTAEEGNSTLYLWTNGNMVPWMNQLQQWWLHRTWWECKSRTWKVMASPEEEEFFHHWKPDGSFWQDGNETRLKRQLTSAQMMYFNNELATRVCKMPKRLRTLAKGRNRTSDQRNDRTARSRWMYRFTISCEC